jgi:hypothetical protein
VFWPPSLDPRVIARSFRSANGELGVLPTDIDAFLSTCQADEIPLLGWELWVVQHKPAPGGPLFAPGEWEGLVPLEGGRTSAVIHGEVAPVPAEPWVEFVDRSVREVRAQLGALTFLRDVDKRYLPFVRFNFTVEAVSG